MFHFPFRAMGCQMRILVDTPHDATGDCQLVVDAVHQWEQTLSRFIPDSELNTLHHHSDQWQPVSPVLWSVLRTAAWAYTHTNGIIDPTIRRSLEDNGYNTTYTAIHGGHTHTSTLPDWLSVRIDPDTPRVWIPAGLTLDLAGVAKSWAAQHALSLLQHYPAAAIDASGDICLHGSPSDTEAWPIGIDALPGFAEPDMLALRTHAIATSGIDQRRWARSDGTLAHHLIDPRTNAPATSDILRASVIAPTLVAADVAARTLCILGQSAGFAWLASQPDHAALVHCSDGTTHTTPGWAAFLWNDDTRD